MNNDSMNVAMPTRPKVPWLRSVPALLLVMVTVLSYLFLATATDLRLMLPELVAISALLVMVLAIIPIIMTTFLVAQPPLGHSGWIVAVILVVAAIIRLLFVHHAPQLSDDLYRYLWDGLQLWQGHNPYAAAPQLVTPVGAEQLALHGKINHPHLVTIYPPAAQLLFAAGAGSLVQFKLLLIALDLGSCLLLAVLLRRLGYSPWWLVLYAWHPLVVLECASSAHIDIAAIFFVLAALVLASSSLRWAGVGSGGCLAMAVMIKVLPLIFVPFFILCLPRAQRKYYLLSGGLVCVGLLVPFWPQIVNGFDTLGLYARHWEFAGFSFQLLRTLFQSGDQARLVLATLFGCVIVSQWWALLQRPVTTEAVIKTCSRFLLLFLLLTPTLHPWYVLYLGVFLPLRPTTAGLVLSWSVLLSYQVVAAQLLSGVWQESALITFYVWLAPVSALLASGWLFLRNRRAAM